MALTGVKMSEEVWVTCLSHALTTDKEEVMGLLLGDIQYTSNGSATAVIWGASPQMRSERRSDRVETNPELLAAASALAERMTLSIGRTTRVIGWYHSHPHHTIHPSHVDVRTQAMYQLLDKGFVGLIFSCFSEDAQKVGRIQVVAFQSLDGKQRAAAPAFDNSVVELESSWGLSENSMSTSSSVILEKAELDSADSIVTKTARRQPDTLIYTDGNQFGKQIVREDNPTDLYRSGVDIDGSDMTPSLQEALHQSTVEMSGAQYVEKEVPLQICPARHLLKLEAPLAAFSSMQNVIFEEERSAYNQAMQQNVHEGKIHPLTSLHHAFTYNSSLCKLMEYCLIPAITALEDRAKENELRLSILMEENKQMEAEIRNRNLEVKMDSPRRALYGAGPVPSADKGSPRGSGTQRKPY